MQTFCCADIREINNSIYLQHEIVYYIVKMLSIPLIENITFVDSDAFTKPLIIPNRLLLYGPPGNGKTTLARQIANVANCEFVHINAPSIVTKYAGSGAENIKKEMGQAFEMMAGSGRPVVIFIDEIDAIAIVGSDESRVEDNKAMQELWLYLDKFKYDPRYFIICATNRYEKLSPAFVSRFPEQQRLKIDQPNKEMRKEVLMNLFEKYEVNQDKNIINDLAYYSDGMSIRELEDFVSQVKLIAIFKAPLDDVQLIKKIKSYPRGYKGAKDSDAPKRDIYDKVHLVSSLFTMASAGTTIATFILGIPYIRSLCDF